MQFYQKNLTLEDQCPQRSMAYWVNTVGQDAIAQSIIQSKPFARLKKVSFLGAIDHLNFAQRMSKSQRSRAIHSLQVAGLASFVAQQRGYSADLKRHLIVAGLLHDIGHPPLSHSVEPYLKKSFGYGHHEMGEAVLTGQQNQSKKLHQLLAASVDINFIKKLISGNAIDEDGGDLFSSPINIDTIEGITRSFCYVKKSSTNLNPVDVAYASFVDKEPHRLNILDDFWDLKNYVYNNIVNRDLGVIADYYSQYFFDNEQGELSEAELFDTEPEWGRKYSKLFSTLARIARKADLPRDLVDVKIKFTSRKYFVDSHKMNIERYQCSKFKSFTRLDSDALNYINQKSFLFS